MRMAKKIDTETKSNFENFKLLKKEFESGKMDTRKLKQLKDRLIHLYDKKLILPTEQVLMEDILKKERSFSKTKKATISDKDLHFLNAIEADRIEDKAIVKTDDLPPALLLTGGSEVKYEWIDDRERVVIYSKVIVPTRHQLSRAIVDKEERGHAVPEDAYPQERYYIHRQILTAKDFGFWFEEVEDLLNGESEVSESEEKFVL